MLSLHLVNLNFISFAHMSGCFFYFPTESGLARDDTDLYSDTSSVGDNSEYGTSTSSRGTRSTG